MVGITAISEHHHFIRHDFDAGMFLAFFIVQAPGLEPALDVNLLSFGEILFTDLREVAPGNYIEPFGFRVTLSISTIPGSAYGYCVRGHRPAGPPAR